MPCSSPRDSPRWISASVITSYSIHYTKLYELCAENARLVHHHLRACLTGMLAGGQGPAHLSLPLDVQKGEVEHEWHTLHAAGTRPRICDNEALERLWELLNPGTEDGPCRVAILAGYGVVKSEAWGLLREFAERYDIPVASTLKAKGVFPEDHPLSFGVFGYVV